MAWQAVLKGILGKILGDSLGKSSDQKNADMMTIGDLSQRQLPNLPMSSSNMMNYGNQQNDTLRNLQQYLRSRYS